MGVFPSVIKTCMHTCTQIEDVSMYSLVFERLLEGLHRFYAYAKLASWDSSRLFMRCCYLTDGYCQKAVELRVPHTLRMLTLYATYDA